MSNISGDVKENSESPHDNPLDYPSSSSSSRPFSDILAKANQHPWLWNLNSEEWMLLITRKLAFVESPSLVITVFGNLYRFRLHCEWLVRNEEPLREVELVLKSIPPSTGSVRPEAPHENNSTNEHHSYRPIVSCSFCVSIYHYMPSAQQLQMSIARCKLFNQPEAHLSSGGSPLRHQVSFATPNSSQQQHCPHQQLIITKQFTSYSRGVELVHLCSMNPNVFHARNPPRLAVQIKAIEKL